MMIQVRDLRKSFGPLKVFDGVSFEVTEGEFIALFGPSGCGKSTLLRLLAALINPDEGQIFINGRQAATDLEAYIDNLSVVWQDPRLAPWRTMMENVRLALELKYRDKPKREMEERARDSLELVGLQSFQDRFPRELSGGMRQRVNLARALVLDAPVMLMDEPLASLNEVTDKRQLMAKIQEIWLHRKKTVVYVTHSLSEAIFLADRILVLSEKPTRILDSVEVNLERPRDMTSPDAMEIQRRITQLLGGVVV